MPSNTINLQETLAISVKYRSSPAEANVNAGGDMAPDIQSDNLSSSESATRRAQKNGLSAVPAASGPGSAALVRECTGPRTPQGKDRSKHNAVKHGIFSNVVVLKGEPQVEFNRLLNGLRDDFQPVGMFEELLVEKLAGLFWRNRRLLIAEAAEIRANSEFIEWDGNESKRKTDPPISFIFSGLIRGIGDPDVLQQCLDLLAELKESIDENGFDLESDKVILAKLYGSTEDQKTLLHSYAIWLNTSLTPEEERQREGYATPQESKDNFLHELNQEIKRLGRYQKEQEAILSAKLQVELLRQNVPDAPQLDRLMRYETSLERSIERTLNQLERTQRMRLGQPVSPPINLNITASKE